MFRSYTLEYSSSEVRYGFTEILPLCVHRIDLDT